MDEKQPPQILTNPPFTPEPSIPVKRGLNLAVILVVIAIVAVLGLVTTLLNWPSIINSSRFISQLTSIFAPQASPTPTPFLNYQTQFRSQIPSSCGYTIGWPTTITNDTPSLEWIYEETPVNASSFRGLAPAEVTTKGVLMATLLFKAQSDKFTENPNRKYTVSQPGLVSYCTNNIKNWTLADFTAYVEKNSTDQLQYTLTGDLEKWGEIEVQGLKVEGIYSGGYINEPLYLAVIPAGSKFSRLVLFQPWAGSDNRLETDRQALAQSLSPRELTSIMSLPQDTTQPASTPTKTTTAPACTQFKIYEGQFASNKCYTKQDLADLQYYLGRYNNAIFDQNASASSIKITCTGSDFFKNQCEADKKRYDQALKDQETYKAKINEYLAKGK